MRRIHLLHFFYPCLAYAHPPIEEMLNQVSRINRGSLGSDLNCSAGRLSAKVDIFPTPQATVEKIFDGKLTFLGRAKFPGSFQNYTCVYKTETAYILYHNCLSSKAEAEATDIAVIDFNGGLTRFYVENSGPGAISELTRSRYNLTWTVDFRPSHRPGQLSVEGLKSFMSRHSAINIESGACYVGGTFKAQDLTQKTICSGPMKDSSVGRSWGSAAEKFWREPGKRWYQALRLLRKAVSGTN